MLDAFAGAVLFVDFGLLNDPQMVGAAVASMLGMPMQSDNPIPGLIDNLRDKHILLILDNCEHVIEAAAVLTERIYLAAPRIHILATSREALRVEGEQVHRLTPLAFPPDEPGLTAAAALTFPATQLFLERAAASGARLELSDADAGIVADICRKLDGGALAIELAAGRVQAYGLQQTAALLDQRLTLLWPGQRTAPARQQSLHATLDWSHELLSDLERTVLRRLAVFVGQFTMEAALAIVTSGTMDEEMVFGAIDSLVGKSMVAPRPVGAMMRYRLLDITRAYVLETSMDDTERADLAARHADYYRRWLEQTGAEWPALANAAQRAPYLAGLGNVRAALDWCFGSNGNAKGGGNTRIGVELAAAAAPVYLAMSRLTECHRLSQTALLALSDAARGGAEEMRLQAMLGTSLMYMRGASGVARAAIDRSLAIAEDLGDTANQLLLIGPLHSFHLRIGHCNTALHYAKRASAVAGTVGDPAAIAFAHTLLGVSSHHTGDLSGARTELEAALRHEPDTHQTGTIYLGPENHLWTGVTLARNLWLQGFPVQAAKRARQVIEAAAATDLPVPLSSVLSMAIPVFLWIGDLETAEKHIDWFMSVAESHSLGPYLATGRGFKGEALVRRGDTARGVENLRNCLDELGTGRFGSPTATFDIPLVQGLAAIGRSAEGIALIDETMRVAERNGDIAQMPEMLRVKGALLLSTPAASDDAERCYVQSLALSRHRGALAWELRTAIDLARLKASQGQHVEARALLRPVFDRFTEGHDTADLIAAESLLAALG